MPTSDLRPNMYDLPDTSTHQRWTLTILGVLWILLAWWLLFAAGLQTIRGWFGWTWALGNPTRRACLAIALSIYYLRLLFTWFVFLKRGVSWKEVFTITPWLFCIVLLLTIFGGRNSTPFGAAGFVGVVLFVIGSWMNSYAEYTRYRWKRLSENQGHLYTQGLFRYSRHPNYFGDLIAFSGLCLIAGAWITAFIPALMLAGFIFVNIPMLDAHLLHKYGRAFDTYARRTRKLIPFVY